MCFKAYDHVGEEQDYTKYNYTAEHPLWGGAVFRQTQGYPFWPYTLINYFMQNRVHFFLIIQLFWQKQGGRYRY